MQSPMIQVKRVRDYGNQVRARDGRLLLAKLAIVVVLKTTVREASQVLKELLLLLQPQQTREAWIEDEEDSLL